MTNSDFLMPSIYDFDFMKKSDVRGRSYNFALRIIKLTQKLPNNIASDSLARQLIRSGTSIGANVEEALSAFAKEDFTYKMSLAEKEARESKFWLSLIKDTVLLFDPEIKQWIQEACDPEVKQLIQEAEELTEILAFIVKTSEENIKKPISRHLFKSTFRTDQS
jgi:four helix bundle protein